jgi:hypothetical protein
MSRIRPAKLTPQTAVPPGQPPPSAPGMASARSRAAAPSAATRTRNGPDAVSGAARTSYAVHASREGFSHSAAGPPGPGKSPCSSSGSALSRLFAGDTIPRSCRMLDS